MTLRATCIYDPRGDHGLEGFQLGDTYKCQRREEYPKGSYWRVWPDDRNAYYETCSARVFNKHFKLQGSTP